MVTSSNCEACQSSHDGSYGSGRFCSVSCARGFATKNKRTEINQKVSQTLTKPISYRSATCAHCQCVFTYQVKRKRPLQFCSTSCVRKASAPAFKETISKLLAENKWSGWAKRKTDVPSYAEQYFIELLQREGISYAREVKAGRWFIDFVIGRLALEIDGKQHERPERIASDKRKDAFLIANGYTVFRIKWANPSTEKGRSLLYPQIERLKQLVSDV